MSGIIDKGPRFAKILGDYGEHLVLAQLARSGFVVSHADQTGLDVIAYKPSTKQRLGITVKSLTRIRGTESHSVNIFRENKRDRKKLLDACEAFGCEPWIAAYVECENYADLYLISLANYDSKFRSKEQRAVYTWAMTKTRKDEYALDPEVRHIRTDFKFSNWWPASPSVS
jgi:hypothetical protein